MKKADTHFKQKLHQHFAPQAELQRTETSQATKITRRKRILCSQVSVFAGFLTVVPATTHIKNSFKGLTVGEKRVLGSVTMLYPTIVEAGAKGKINNTSYVLFKILIVCSS